MTLAFLALLGAPYIYISSLRVNAYYEYLYLVSLLDEVHLNKRWLCYIAYLDCNTSLKKSSYLKLILYQKKKYLVSILGWSFKYSFHCALVIDAWSNQLWLCWRCMNNFDDLSWNRKKILYEYKTHRLKSYTKTDTGVFNFSIFQKSTKNEPCINVTHNCQMWHIRNCHDVTDWWICHIVTIL